MLVPLGLAGWVTPGWAEVENAAAPIAVGGFWIPQGPAPTADAQADALPNKAVSGAIQVVAPHPTRANTIYVGAANGGIWKTNNATSQNVLWRQLTDFQTSLSIGSLEFDPTDPPRNTLVAGVGQYSSFGDGGPTAGIYRTTNGGNSWTLINGGGTLANKRIGGVAARGATLVAAVDRATPNNLANVGVFRSIDGGATFTQISTGNGAATGLPGGLALDLAGDPNNNNRLYTAMLFATLVGGQNGIYRSDDIGGTWIKVSPPALDAQIISGGTSDVEIVVGKTGAIAVAIANSGRLAAVWHSADGGTTWNNLGVPTTTEAGGVVFGAHPGAQAIIHLSIAADPTNQNLVYVGGDRQPAFTEGVGFVDPVWPNSIGASDFTGRIFRGDASAPAATRWVHITHSNTLGPAGGGTASNTAPHADSRKMAFDAQNNLIETDDGGIYKRTKPKNNTGDWFSLNGNLQNYEFHSIGYDSFSNISFGGAQDNGTPVQDQSFKFAWSLLFGGDGGDVAADATSSATISYRYNSAQNLGGFLRTEWDAANELVAFTFPALTVLGGGAPIVPQFVTPVELNGVDPTRLVIGGANSVYESLDQGDTVVEAGPGLRTNGTGTEPIAYGAAGNPDAIYVGSTDRIFVRTGAYPAPFSQSLTYPGAGRTVTDLVLDPADAARAFVINTGQVFFTTDSGATWTNATGNLPTLNPGLLRSVVYVSSFFGDAVIVGTQNNVFLARESDGYAVWEQLGNFLPVVPVFDLSYDPKLDLLVAGTLGRGAFLLPGIQFAIKGF
ncbi:MAG: RTX toxin [Thermoanaerobaculia bacterium]|nr:RTX toxin [Thermoanaerobaculia bacterium]